MNTSNDPRQAIRDALLQSYLHRNAEGCVCALCGAQDRQLAFHLLEMSIIESEPLPSGFVPMAHSRGCVRGSFPVCDKCAPPCKSCHLPIRTPAVGTYCGAAHARLGLGYCREHMHWRYLLAALIKKLF